MHEVDQDVLIMYTLIQIYLMFLKIIKVYECLYGFWRVIECYWLLLNGFGFLGFFYAFIYYVPTVLLNFHLNYFCDHYS